MELKLISITISKTLSAIILIFLLFIQVPAGLFIPSMAIGALTGRMLGIAMEQLA